MAWLSALIGVAVGVSLAHADCFPKAPSATLPGVPGGPFVVLRYHTTFAAKPVWENVTMVRESAGAWRVIGYTLAPFEQGTTGPASRGAP